jgi:hypothetical protein
MPPRFTNRKRKAPASKDQESGKEGAVSKRTRQSKKEFSKGRNDQQPALKHLPVSAWSVDLVCEWAKGILDSSAAVGLFETEEKEKLVGYFSKQRINGHILSAYREEDIQELLKEAVPDKRGPRSYLDIELKKLLTSSASLPEQAPGAPHSFICLLKTNLDILIDLVEQGKKRRGPEKISRIDGHFRTQKISESNASEVKQEVMGEQKKVRAVRRMSKAIDWSERLQQQTEKIKDAREQFCERLRDQKSSYERLKKFNNDLSQLLSEAVGKNRYADTTSWTNELRLLLRTVQGKQKLSTIVVVGDTGTGKSSLLNAILDESAVLPTNCNGRACTGLPLSACSSVI